MNESILPDFEHIDFVVLRKKVKTEPSDDVPEENELDNVCASDEYKAFGDTELENKVNSLIKECTHLKQEVNDLKGILMQQNAVIMKMLHDQTGMIQHLQTVDVPFYDACGYRFPLETQQDLDDLEAEINDVNSDALVVTVQRLIAARGLAKDTKNIFSLKLLLDYNVDGTQRKKRLLDYPKTIELIQKAVALQEGLSGKQFLDELRKGLRMVKARHFKNVCDKRKRERKLQQQQETRQQLKIEIDDDETGNGSEDFLSN